MAPGSRRTVGWLPLVTFLAVLPAAWLVSHANAEPRKFAVLLANPTKERNSNAPLPNIGVIWDSYFDKDKNGPDPLPRVDSHAEWWQEISYGDVTVSGDVYGWVNLPWPTVPPGGVGTNIPWVELTGGFSYNAGRGENFTPFAMKYEVDLDGRGGNPAYGNFDPTAWPGAGQIDQYLQPVFTPGERFVDLNNDRRYQAGVWEWGIDKNGNGVIDVDSEGDNQRYNARSFAELFACQIMYPPQDAPQGTLPEFQRWLNDTEWFDSNNDGQWNRDGTATIISGIPWVGFRLPFAFWWGDWGGTEIYIPRGMAGQMPMRATRNEQEMDPDFGGPQGSPSTLWRFLVENNRPMNAMVSYFDQQWNDNFDFPEPFEDFMRRWDPDRHLWIRTNDEYIEANYPGDTAILKTYDIEHMDTPETNPEGRTANGRFDGYDRWGQRANTINSTNKLQRADVELENGAENAEQAKRSNLLAVPPETYNSSGNGWSLDAFWTERYGSPTPQWEITLPYFRTFNPMEETPRYPGIPAEDIPIPFEPNRGGPTNNGRDFDGNRYTRMAGTVLPDPRDGRDGLYDGPAEYDDLPSSIYHQFGDGGFGEVTSPVSNANYGDDTGAHSANSPANPDTILPAAGPLAFNVHGDGGWDGGNQFTLELLTWRQDGQSNTDRIEEIDFDGDGVPDLTLAAYHKDTNLDGLLDLGEAIGDAGQFGLPTYNYYSYGVSADPGAPKNGDPSNDYPFNRKRAMEDTVAALDDNVRWDNFLNGPGPFGNRISGLILLPNDTGPGGMFTLPAGGGGLAPAPAGDWPIRTRDLANDAENGRDHFVQLSFFDGLGISLNGSGEGGLLPNIGNNGTAFSGHEYGHRWEGYPDLYDYDVYSPFPINIDNNPVAQWCVMAGGGLCHPVPILKEDSGWLDVADITRALTPAITATDTTQIVFRPWEFNRDKTVFRYVNSVSPGEQFYFWRNAIGGPAGGSPNGVSFDRIQPGHGLLIMHVDRGTDPDALPPQQRIGSHSTYQLVQADGFEQLQNGENGGDAGDVFPGTANRTVWNRGTDPNNRWFSAQGSGLEITNIVVQPNERSLVTFLWTPQELPILRWVQPPGGISVSGIYSLRFFAFDQFGGTTIQMFAFKNVAGQPLSYDAGIPLGSTTKTPGEVDGVYGANVRNLQDGTYTFYAKLVPGIGTDGRRERSNSVPRASLDNVGTGVLNVTSVNLNVSRFERWTVRCTSAAPQTFSVVGTASGPQPDAAVDTPYSNQYLNFNISNGSIPFAVGDTFSFLTTGLTPHSGAVLIDDGEVVQPLPPVAVPRIESGSPTGLAPLALTFKHDQSIDPRGAVLTFRWDFGDGSPVYVTDRLDQPVPHTYTVPAAAPYVATLTATNSFGLSSTASLNITVQEALGPTVRITADPVTGIRPLRVRFTGDLTTDPNPGTSGLDFVWDFGDGSPTVPQANGEHTYTNAGIYRATLTVTNRPYNKSSSRTVEIRVTGPAANQPPTATIDVDKRFGTAPLVVRFDAARSSDPEVGPLTYTWNFGDGSPLLRGVSTADHTFTKEQSFNVTLTVADNQNQTDTATIAVVVIGSAGAGNQAPVARIIASGTQGAAPFTVTFDASSSADPETGPLSYAWDFGDGSPQAVGAIVSHTFTEPQRYSVVLVVADSQNAKGAASVDISVTSPAGTNDSGQDVPSIANPDLSACGTSCGPVGLMPMVFTLIGIGGMRRFGKRYIVR